MRTYRYYVHTKDQVGTIDTLGRYSTQEDAEDAIEMLSANESHWYFYYVSTAMDRGTAKGVKDGSITFCDKYGAKISNNTCFNDGCPLKKTCTKNWMYLQYNARFILKTTMNGAVSEQRFLTEDEALDSLARKYDHYCRSGVFNYLASDMKNSVIESSSFSPRNSSITFTNGDTINYSIEEIKSNN